ncbi:MAG: serine hydrolase [Pseudoxanthomonas sp.]
MKRWLGLGGGLLFLLLAALGWKARPDRALRVGTAVVAKTLCDDIFVTKLDPRRAYLEDVYYNPGLAIIRRHLSYIIDLHQQQVTARWLGRFASKASYQSGYGCTLGSVPLRKALPSVLNGQKPVQSIIMGSTALQAALARAFREPAAPPYRQVRAIVVMRDGQVVAERYAPGIGPDTPLPGYSVSKSLIHALIGILVRQKRLVADAPAPVAGWRSAHDSRNAITLAELMNMTSGLDFTENESGFDPVSRMLFIERDMAGFAESARLKNSPGKYWEYTSGNTLIVSKILRDTVGGHAEDVLRFARRELFDPLNMRSIVMEFDAVDTPVGSTGILASARDWARFGQLYLDNGQVDGRSILPQGWVARAAQPTLGTSYGEGFWTNAGNDPDARWRIAHGMPPDTFYASGNFGQRIVIIPSHHLVRGCRR